jgi:hypothetical protein
MDLDIFISISVYDILPTFACENLSPEISFFRLGVVEAFYLQRCMLMAGYRLPDP